MARICFDVPEFLGMKIKVSIYLLFYKLYTEDISTEEIGRSTYHHTISLFFPSGTFPSAPLSRANSYDFKAVSPFLAPILVIVFVEPIFSGSIRAFNVLI